MPGPEIVRRNFRQYDRDLGLTGLFAPNPLYAGTANTILTASTLYVARFIPSRPFNAALIAYVVTSFATADDNVDVGIFNSAGTRLVSSGATAGKLNTSNGVKTVSFTATPLAAGVVYYAALACGTVGGTAATLSMHNAATAGSQFFGSSMPNIGQGTYAANPTLPASVSISPTGGVVPLLAVRES